MKKNIGLFFRLYKEDLINKKIGLWTLVSIGVGGMIGSGIFAMPAAIAAVAGPALVLAVIFAGLIVVFQALPYAELGSAFPLEGGPYAFPRLAMGDTTGFLIGWGYYVNAFVGTAAIINVFVNYLGFYIPGLSVHNNLTLIGTVIAIAIVWVFTLINVLGVKWGGLYSIITTIGKIIPIIIFVVIGFFYFNLDNFTPFMPYGFTGFALGIPLFFWAYTGFETVVVPTGEVKNPSKTIPLAMMLTLLITILVYLLVVIVFTGMVNWEALNISLNNWKAFDSIASPLAAVPKSLGLTALAVIATIGAILATGGAGGVWVLIQGRMPFAMAKDKLFWSAMSKVSPRFETPSNSLIFSSILTTIVIIAIPNFPSIALIASITAVFSYGSAILSVLILRKTKSDTKRYFRIPCIKVFCLVGFILSTFLIYWASWPWTFVGTLLINAGYIIYLFIRKGNKSSLKRSLWVPVYLLSISFISLIGDPIFTFNNILPIKPLGIIRSPYDLIALSVLAVLIFTWIYKINVKEELWKQKV
jgi:amino acid transporter